MAMVCTECNTICQQRLQCPTCGARLGFRPGSRSRLLRFPGSWMQSFPGRLVLGLLLAQGLYFGLRHFTLGILLALRGEEGMQELLSSSEGLILQETLRLVPLFLGTVLAGAGQRQAFLLGFVIGLFNSFLCMLGQALLAHQPSTLSWYGQPLSQAFSGSIGAWLGSTIWKPLVPATAQSAGLRTAKEAAKGRKRTLLLVGPVYWFRVSLGMLLTVAGTLWAEWLLQSVLAASKGLLDTQTYTQDLIFTWEIRALAMLFGGALAGASTSNGFKQGLCVSLGSCFLLLLIPHGRSSLLIALGTVSSTLLLCSTGGWFGSQLFPPLIPKPNLRNSLHSL